MSGDFLPEGTLRGLPGPLPADERILWQGAPTIAGLLVRVFHARLVMVWFAATAAAFGLACDSLQSALGVVGPTLLIGMAGIGVLALLSWLTHRTTVYTITDRRVVLHAGIALPITINLPFSKIEGAGLRAFTDGSGDVPLQLQAGVRVAYLQLWPHGRPWHLSQPEPMMRSVPDAAGVADILAQAFAARTQGFGALPVVVARSEVAGRGRNDNGHLVAAE